MKTGTVTQDQQAVGRLSRVDALQGQQLALAQARRRAAELERIEDTLMRLGDEEYGYCQECGEPIAPRRLALDPTVTTCIACATWALLPIQDEEVKKTCNRPAR